MINIYVYLYLLRFQHDSLSMLLARLFGSKNVQVILKVIFLLLFFMPSQRRLYLKT